MPLCVHCSSSHLRSRAFLAAHLSAITAQLGGGGKNKKPNVLVEQKTARCFILLFLADRAVLRGHLHQKYSDSFFTCLGTGNSRNKLKLKCSFVSFIIYGEILAVTAHCVVLAFLFNSLYVCILFMSIVLHQKPNGCVYVQFSSDLNLSWFYL